MVEHGQGPRSGARDNGLRCAGYVAVGDLDPRVADDLLESLRAEGIAAYVTPTPGARGGYLEVQVPSQLTDRLFADSARADRAIELLAAAPQRPVGAPPAPPDDSPIDFASEWQRLVGTLQTPDGQAPDGEPVPASEPAADPYLDEHYVPPAPPPLPRLRPITVVALLSIIAGLLVLITNFDGGDLVWLAVLAILGGGATLVYQVKEGPPTDSGWDDGAVV
jgi:hypothetical protein